MVWISMGDIQEMYLEGGPCLAPGGPHGGALYQQEQLNSLILCQG